MADDQTWRNRALPLCHTNITTATFAAAAMTTTTTTTTTTHATTHACRMLNDGEIARPYRCADGHYHDDELVQVQHVVLRIRVVVVAVWE